MTLLFTAGSNFKLKTSLIGSHLDTCSSMEHVPPSYAHIVLKMSLTHWVKFEPKFYAQILHQCTVSSLGQSQQRVEEEENRSDRENESNGFMKRLERNWGEGGGGELWILTDLFLNREVANSLDLEVREEHQIPQQ